MYKLRFFFTPLQYFLSIFLCAKRFYNNIYIYCKICRLRCELGMGLLLKPCLCKGEECVCIYPKLTINNDCIQHRTLNLLQSLKNAEFPPEISIFYKQMKIVDDELCRSYLSIFMRIRRWMSWCAVRTYTHRYNSNIMQY